MLGAFWEGFTDEVVWFRTGKATAEILPVLLVASVIILIVVTVCLFVEKLQRGK
jgi:hypothetical protein